MAAQEFRAFVTSSRKLWHDALTTLSGLPTYSPPTFKALCAFVKGHTLDLHRIKEYTKQDSNKILDCLKPKKHKPLTNSVVKKPRPNKVGVVCSCADCGKQFPSPYHLNLHLTNSAQKEACPNCGQMCMRGQDLIEHLESVHLEKWSLCDKCPLVFESEHEIKKHKKEAHKSGVLTCRECGRTFPRRTTFEVHLQMHEVRTCRHCGAQFANRACYREHRSNCEPEAKPDAKSMPRNRRANMRDPADYTCDYCGKSYLSRPQLKNHITWIHMDVRPHQCQWCGKRFYTPARLSEHVVVHTRERKFGCDICGARLVSKMAAVYHRRRHTGEKPYECEDCGDKFISASRRSEHAKRRHGKGSRFQCSQCPAAFVRTTELRKHVDKIHSIIVSKDSGRLLII